MAATVSAIWMVNNDSGFGIYQSAGRSLSLALRRLFRVNVVTMRWKSPWKGQIPLRGADAFARTKLRGSRNPRNKGL
jgi:hypothetical protein